MLLCLTIRDVVIIDRLTIEFNEGFTVLTGETGAGKSILLDSLSLALGMRGDAGLIRKNAEQASVTAEFTIDKLPPHHELRQLLKEHAIDDAEGRLILKRILPRIQRSRAFINDQPVSIQLLHQIGGFLLEIHGQFDRLFNVASHQTALDLFASSTEYDVSLNDVAESFKAWKNSLEDVRRLQKALELNQQKHDFYESVVKELSPVNLEIDEVERLEKERNDIHHFGRMSEVIKENLKSFDQSSVISMLSLCKKNCERINTVDIDTLTQLIGSFDRVMIDLEDVRETMADILKDTSNSSDRLQEIDERLHLLKTLARKYLVPVENLALLLEEARSAIDAASHEDDLIWMEKETLLKQKKFETNATQLTKLRIAAGEKLSELIEAELKFLKLENARFRVRISPLPLDQANKHGLDNIAFEIAANKGQDFAPLNKAASGGEMARIMLALKVILVQSNALTAIVFDEIDTGVGGAVAAAIGNRMRRLSHDVQVLSITHSPQVAAKAHNHKIVYKEHLESETKTYVRSLESGVEREDEIARMLSGDAITEEAKSAARALLA